MAFYKYNENTRQLIEISDFPLAPDTGEAVSQYDVSKADLLGLYSWDSSSLSFVDKVSRVLTKREFLKRFTPTEYATIKAATVANGAIDYYWQLFMVAEFVDIDDPDTIGGIQTLESIGLIGAGRAAEILG